MRLETIDLKGSEDWREYDWHDPAGNHRIYRIDKPVQVAFRKGGGTHRVVDSTGVVHVVPAVGWYGCVLRFQGTIVR